MCVVDLLHSELKTDLKNWNGNSKIDRENSLVTKNQAICTNTTKVIAKWKAKNDPYGQKRPQWYRRVVSFIYVKHFELPCVERCYINKLALPILQIQFITTSQNDRFYTKPPYYGMQSNKITLQLWFKKWLITQRTIVLSKPLVVLDMIVFTQVRIAYEEKCCEAQHLGY